MYYVSEKRSEAYPEEDGTEEEARMRQERETWAVCYRDQDNPPLFVVVEGKLDERCLVSRLNTGAD